MLIIEFYGVEAKFNELEDVWECNDKYTLELLENYSRIIFKTMPYDMPFRVRGVGGYIVDKLRKIYGHSAVKVIYLKPARIPTYDKDGNPVVE